MYIDFVPNRGSKPAILLRESIREGKRIRKRTIANLSALTLEQAQASVTMDAYKEWEFYAQQRPQNVAQRAGIGGRRTKIARWKSTTSLQYIESLRSR